MSDEQKQEPAVEAPKEKEEVAAETPKENAAVKEQKESAVETSKEEKEPSLKTESNNKNEEGTTEKKNKKINLMSLKELDQAIDKTKKNQGGLFSRYAQELLKRKDFLTTNAKK